MAQKKAAQKKAGKSKMLTVKQTGSSTRRPATQHATLVGLGLGRIGKVRTLEDTPSIRGMINKVAHMVEIIEE